MFVENGDRTNRKRARLKYVIEKWGLPKYLEEVERKLAFRLPRLPLDQCEPRKAPIEHGHIGVFKQAQRGLNYIGVVITVGRMKPKQMRRIADVAQHYGSGEVRLTVWQNLIIPNVPDAFVETVNKNLVKMGFHYSATRISGGLIACTGNTGCQWAATNTKGQAVLLARHLEKKVQLDLPINIHLTGCPNSCAQHYMGDIGLLEAKVSQGGETVEGYHVVLGGGFGEKQAVAREVFWGVPFSELPTLLERVLKVFMNGCPVNAYHKDPITGIVRHLDDQCIGCQYCILKCPYDVPKYSKKRGIVRKCDMCSSRLAAAEAPACVQACPNEAISITIVNKELITQERKRTSILVLSLRH